jgi:GTP-binding protein HflX
MPILLTDTVGFIKNLPAYIIDAFHSTLEEIEVADVVVLIADISEKKEIIADKLKVSIKELIEIGVTSPIIIALNKTDLISDDELNDKLKYITEQGLTKNKKIICISIKNNYNIDKLLDLIYESLPQLIKYKIVLPINKETQSFISWIYKKAHVLEISYKENVTIHIESNIILKEKIISRCKELNGKVLLN